MSGGSILYFNHLTENQNVKKDAKKTKQEVDYGYSIFESKGSIRKESDGSC